MCVQREGYQWEYLHQRHIHNPCLLMHVQNQLSMPMSDICGMVLGPISRKKERKGNAP